MFSLIFILQQWKQPFPFCLLPLYTDTDYRCNALCVLIQVSLQEKLRGLGLKFNKPAIKIKDISATVGITESFRTKAEALAAISLYPDLVETWLSTAWCLRDVLIFNRPQIPLLNILRNKFSRFFRKFKDVEFENIASHEN